MATANGQPERFHSEDYVKKETPTLVPEPIGLAKFMAMPVLAPKTIIHGLLDSSSRMIFGGGSKTYKTWAMSDLGISIAAGVQWWNFDVEQFRVLYVNFELKDYYAKLRLRSICEAKGIGIPNDDQFRIWNLRGIEMSLLEFKSILTKYITEHQIMVVFIDPFYRLLGSQLDERVSADLMEVLSVFEIINRETDCTIVCAAHFTKGNQALKDPMDRISGGACMSRNPDSLITLTSHEKDGAFTVDIITRDFAPIDPFVMKWDHPLLKPSDLDPDDIKKPGPKGFSQDSILEVLREFDDRLNLGELQKKLNERLGMSKSTFHRYWSQLKKDNLVFISKANECVNLVPKACDS